MPYDGKFRVCITPEKGKEGYLQDYFKKNYPQSHVYWDGFFLHFEINTDCSCMLLIKIKELPGVKSVFLNMEIKPKKEIVEMMEQKNLQWEKTFPAVFSTINIIPEKNYDTQEVAGELAKKFPNAKISRNNGHIVLKTSAELVTDLLAKIQTVTGIKEALYAKAA